MAKPIVKRKPEPPCVYIVDDDTGVRESLAWLFQSVGIRSVHFASAGEFLAHRPADPRGCMLLDIRMPGQSGLQLHRALRDADVDMPTIFITGHGETQAAVEAFKGGAFDFIEKPFAQQAMLDRVQAALKYDEQRQAALDRVFEAEARLGVLTAREREVLSLLVEGFSNKEVGERLELSLKTVETHRARIMFKTDATSFAELVRLALIAQSNEKK